MRVSRAQIIKGATDYVQNDILPKMDNDRAVQIILCIAVNAVAANGKIIDNVFSNDIVRSMLDDDGSGTYEINGIADAMRKSIDQYGSFPINIPAIPLVSPNEITLKMNTDDVDALRRRIENAI